MIYYDLETLEAFSCELGFTPSRTSSDDLEVLLRDGVTLVFRNLRGEEDTLVGFKGTPWHSHGKLMLMFDDASYAEFDELDILQGLKNGDIMIGEQYLNHALEDRWLVHQQEKVDIRHMQPGEEMRIWRMA